MSSPHAPVMLAEVLAALQPAPGQRIVDGTFGAGGYTRALLAAGAEVVGFDRDPTVIEFAQPLIDAGGFTLVGDRFSPCTTIWAMRPSTGWCSTWASRQCSSTRPSAVFRSCATVRWTCGWAGKARPPPIWSIRWIPER